jgi:PAS domain S-box-containing protein
LQNVPNADHADAKRPSIVNVAHLIVVLVITIFATSLILLLLQSNNSEQKNLAITMRKNHVAIQKHITRREVERIIHSIRERREFNRNQAITIAKQRVYQAHDMAEGIYNSFQSKASATDIQEMILSSLRTIRFDNGNGYYFVESLDGNILVAGRPEIEGKHYADLSSTDEQQVMQKFIELARENKEGLYEYVWSMPGKSAMDHHKFSYVKLFEPYDLIIGTGLYLDDIDEVTKQEFMREIANIQYGQNGYFFINDLQGNILAHGAQPELIGTSIWDYEDSHGTQVFQELLKAVQNPAGEFCQYWWKKPESGEERPKIAFAMAVPEWNWLIGTGLYTDDVEDDVQMMHSRLTKQSNRQIRLVLLSSLAIILLVFILLGILFKVLRRDLAFFNQYLTMAAQQDVQIDESKIKFIELLRIAKNANSMLREKAQILQNLSEDKQQLFVTLQSITDAVITTNARNEVVLSNAVAENMMTCSQQEAIGKPIMDAITFKKDQTETPYTISLPTDLNQESSIEIPEDVSLCNAEGVKYKVEMINAPIETQEGAKQGHIYVFRDVTEKRRSEEERLRLKKLESVGILAGGIAHDFNNLLTSLMGNVDLVKSHLQADSPANEYIAQAESAMEAAKQLALQLLTFSKGGAPIRRVISLKDELVTSAAFALRGSNIKLKTHICEDLLPVEADIAQIHQVMSNLIINAKQAMPNGGTIFLTAQNKGSDWIQVTVKDEGCGIPPDILDRIFDPYFTTKSTGSGLGLASSHAIIRKHGGSIAVDSTPGQGTSFTIQLPVSHKPIEPDTESDKTSAPTPENSRPAKILVIDDMASIRTLLMNILTLAGHMVQEASDDTQAKALFTQAVAENSPFDLVITDVTIPGSRGGKEIADDLKEIDPDAQIIVSSGYAGSPVVSEFKKHGFVACIPKPYRANNVMEVVNTVLHSRA